VKVNTETQAVFRFSPKHRKFMSLYVNFMDFHDDFHGCFISSYLK